MSDGLSKGTGFLGGVALGMIFMLCLFEGYKFLVYFSSIAIGGIFFKMNYGNKKVKNRK